LDLKFLLSETEQTGVPSSRYFFWMPATTNPDPELLPIHRPRCPFCICKTRMITAAIAAGPQGFEQRYERSADCRNFKSTALVRGLERCDGRPWRTRIRGCDGQRLSCARADVSLLRHPGEGRHRRGGHRRHPDGVFPDVGKLRLCRSSDGGLRRLLGSPAGAKLLGRRLVAAEQIAAVLRRTKVVVLGDSG
jgi:hypothetical protein